MGLPVAGRVGWLSWASLLRTLITSQRPYLQIPSRWGLGFNISIGWGWEGGHTIQSLGKRSTGQFTKSLTMLENHGRPWAPIRNLAEGAEPSSSHRNSLLRMPPPGCGHLTLGTMQLGAAVPGHWLPQASLLRLLRIISDRPTSSAASRQVQYSRKQGAAGARDVPTQSGQEAGKGSARSLSLL